MNSYSISSCNEYEAIITIKNIESVVAWRGQRPLDENKVQEIVDYKLQHKLDDKISDFGEIHVCAYKSSNDKKLYIIDGQHRFAAYKKLHDNYQKQMPKLRALLHYIKREEDMRDIFNVINRCTPVPEIYLEGSGEIKRKLKANLEQYCRNHNLKIGSGGCKRPAIDLDKYSEQLYSEEYMDLLCNISSLSKLLDFLCVYIHKNLDLVLTKYKSLLNISDIMIDALHNYKLDSRLYLGYFYSTNKKGLEVIKSIIRDSNYKIEKN